MKEYTLNKIIPIIMVLPSLLGLASACSQNTKLSSGAIIIDDTISITSPGKYFFSSTICNDTMICFTQVSSVSDSASTLIIKFDEEDKSGIKDLPSILKIYNPYPLTMFYKLKGKSEKNNGEFRTEVVLPLSSKKFTISAWPYEFQAIKVYNFKLKK